MALVLASVPALLEELPGISELIVDLADVDPGDAEWVRPGEVRKDTPVTPAYDAVIELTGTEDLLAQAAAAIERDWRGRTALLWLYRTTLMPARVDRSRPVGRSPGVKYIVLCRFHADMPPSAVQRSWAHHVPLALRVHVGADIYIRHWVDEVLTPGAPPEQGVTELHFPTWEDMRERWFVSDEARQQIIQDIGHFLASGTRLYTTEHVLKSPDPA
jgi:hypothetical protein